VDRASGPKNRWDAGGLKIESAQRYDATWIRLLLTIEPVGSGSLAWSRFWRQTRNSHSRGVAEYWDVIRPMAFCHWRVRHDGVRVVDEIVVAPAMRRRGLASALLRRVGEPVEMHVPTNRPTACGWAEAVGFQPAAVLNRPNGRRFIVYRLG
jgi:GNAT superfamily N-acetyltransferase